MRGRIGEGVLRVGLMSSWCRMGSVLFIVWRCQGYRYRAGYWPWGSGLCESVFFLLKESRYFFVVCAPRPRSLAFRSRVFVWSGLQHACWSGLQHATAQWQPCRMVSRLVL